MPSKSVVVGSAVGLHARPAAIIAEKAGEQVQCYTMGEFIDFCLGPHLPSTSQIKAFKLKPEPAAAYWSST